MKLAKDMFTMSVLVGREGDAIPDSFCKLQRRCTQSGKRTEKYVFAFTCQVGPIRRVLNVNRWIIRIFYECEVLIYKSVPRVTTFGIMRNAEYAKL